MMDPIDEIALMTVDQRRAVCRWAEDRFVNDIMLMSVHLQRERQMAIAGETVRIAKYTVDRVMGHVNEIRRVAGHRVDQRWGDSAPQGAEPQSLRTREPQGTERQSHRPEKDGK